MVTQLVTITALNVYPVKSCRGIALERALITATGFAGDREWLIVRPNGQFVTQRDEPRLALIEAISTESTLTLSAPDVGAIVVSREVASAPMEVTCWRDKCAAFDAGPDAAAWLQGYLGKPYRLVRFDAARQRLSDRAWTQGIEAQNQFSDGFPWLVISQASLDDLNSRLEQPLPMNRFRPNIVIDGLPAYGEDEVHEFSTSAAPPHSVRLRAVKACTRCGITTTDQVTAERRGDEPLQTLRGYRFRRDLMGVVFGQNLILVDGIGQDLHVGQQLEVDLKQ